MKNYVREALDKRGITPIEAHRHGMPYQSVYRQYRGQRRPSGEFVLLYEQKLGIHRSELRPDLWPPEEIPHAADQERAQGPAVSRAAAPAVPA